MPQHTRYQNPPIREMTCEFRFAGPGWDQTIPGLLYVSLERDFPVRDQAGLVAVTEDQPPGQFQLAQAVRFKQADGLAFIQLSPNTLSFHRLAPYPGWESVRPLIQKVFDVYCQQVKPKTLTRIGLRYINDIVFDELEVEPKDFFNFYMEVGPTLPQLYAELKASVLFTLRPDEASLRLQLNGIVADTNKVTLRLDLDHLTQRGDYLQPDRALAGVEAAHTELRQVFEACLKPPLVARFGEQVLVGTEQGDSH